MRWKYLLLVLGLGLALLLAACNVSPGATGTPGPAPDLSRGPATDPERSTAAFPVFTSQQQTGLVVSGEGKVIVVPDVAILNLGVGAQASTVEEARRQAAGAMEAIMAALKGRGVDQKDIKTQWFNIAPVTRWVEKGKGEPGQEVIVGYRVDNMVVAKIRKVDEAGSIIDAVATAGGDLSRVRGISFTIDDPTRFLAQARELAVKDALAKAQQLAHLSGAKLGKPIFISESGGWAPPVPMARAAAMEAKGAGPATPISPGESEVRLDVQITFSLLE